MKIKMNTKDTTVDFIPEKDIDFYYLGLVFGCKSHSITAVNNKVTKVTVKIFDMWAYLLKSNLNA